MKVKNKAFLYIFFVIVCIIALFPVDQSTELIEIYLFDGLLLTLSLAVLIIRNKKRKINVFEPLSIISVIYILMYFVVPMFDIILGETLWYGYDVFTQGMKGSLFAFVGFACLLFSYDLPVKWKDKRKYNLDRNDKNLKIIVIIMYMVCLISNVLYLVLYDGNGIIYSFSFGLIGRSNMLSNSYSSIGFVSMLSYSLPSLTLLLFELINNKYIKFFIFYLMFSLQITRGFRFFVIQIVFMFLSYYYIKNDKTPKIKQIVFIAIVVTIPIMIMTLYRSSIRMGGGVDFSIIDYETISEGLEMTFLDNFRIYKNYYGMINTIPTNYFYVFGRQMIVGTIVMVIPRILWANKISSYGGVSLQQIIGNNVAIGQAYPNLGEYYYCFGIFGIIFWMNVYGLWMRYVKYRYKDSKNILDLIIYVNLLSVNLQLLIRGYTPSNFWFIVFSVLPLYVVKTMYRYRKRG